MDESPMGEDIVDDLPVNEEVVYPEGIDTVELEKGRSVDLMMLLSRGERDFLVRNNGDQVKIESLKGKFIMVCCFLVPEEDGGESRHSTIEAHCELMSRADVNLEMIMVAKMRPIYEDSIDTFDDFFSAFSNSCLSIPFSDPHSRDVVCRSVGLTSRFMPIAVLALDPNHKVLQCKGFDESLYMFGADCFPFTDEKIETLHHEQASILSRVHYLDFDDGEGITPATLEDIVQGNPSDVLHNWTKTRKTTLSQLSEKHVVGLYMCEDGGFIDILYDLHQQCLRENHDFEVVIAFLPESHEHLPSIKTSLNEKKVSWWVLDLRAPVSHRLSVLSGNDDADGLTIIGPGGKFVESYGKDLITHFGVAAYPFSREAIIDKDLASLQSLTLESLLMVSAEQNYLVRDDDERVAVSELRGRNILVYLDSLPPELSVYQLLIDDWYPELRKNDPNFEVVFVPTNTEGEQEFKLSKLHLPWLLFPFDPTFVLKQLFWEQRNTSLSTLVAFGKDGKVQSIKANVHLSKVTEFQFPGELRQEVRHFTQIMIDGIRT